MTSVPFSTPPTVAAGQDRINARQLDAQFKQLVDRINALIAAIGVLREGEHAWFRDGAVRWRSFAQRTIIELREIIAAVKAMRNTRRLIYSVPDPQLDFSLLPWPDFPVSGSQHLWFKHGLSSTTGWIEDTIPPINMSLVEVVYWNRSMMEATVVRAASMPITTWFTDHTALPTGFYADDRLFMVDRSQTSDHIDIAVSDYDHLRAEVLDGSDTRYEWLLTGVYVPASSGLTPSNPWPTQVVAEALGWTQSSKFTAVVRPGWVFRIQYRNDDHNGIFSSETAYPPDDPYFPYMIRHRDGVGWQLDLLRVRKLPENHAQRTLLVQTGGWLEGAGPCGFLEVE